MDKLQAVHSFWASFGWAAYNENSVPVGAQRPYITHELGVSDFDRPIAQTAKLCTHSTGWGEAIQKMKEIEAAIPRGGKYLHYDGGAVLIRKESPWGQDYSTQEEDHEIILNYSLEYMD